MISRRAALAAPLALAAQTPVPAPILAMEKQWIGAVLKADTAVLERILSPDLMYGHASGVLDTKSAYIAKIKAKRQIYRTLEQFHLTARAHGNDTVVTHCWARVTGTNPEGLFDDKIMMLHVWVRTAGGWQLAGHQTARVTEIPK